MTGVERVLAQFRPAIDDAIRSALSGRPSSLLYEMIRYHLGMEEGARKAQSSGKRVRAALCMLSCEAAGGSAAAAAPAAAAVELVHSFTLLHDDIADRDDLRRGRPTVWRKWGVGQAITAGDALYALANLAAARLADTGARSDLVASVLTELNQATLAVCEGQQLDISLEGDDSVTPAAYMPMVERKTAALFAAACSIGAGAAGATEAKRLALREFGRQVGIGFQVADDVLGIWGDPKEMGKPVASDIRRNKRSLPIIYALHSSDRAAAELLVARLRAGVESDDEASELAALIERVGARRYCERIADECLAKAKTALDASSPTQAAAAQLRALARFLVKRSR